MNEDEKPIEGAEDDSKQQTGDGGTPAGQSEGAAPDANPKDVQKMYDELGIKAKAPTDKSSKRPKTDGSGDKKAAKQDDGSEQSDKKQNADDSKKQPKASSTSDKDGVDGDETDKKGSKDSKKDGKDGEEDGEVPEASGDDEGRVRESKSKDSGKTEGSSGKDADEGASEDGQGSDEPGATSEEGKEDGQEKRPGKSNPEVEKRFQKLTSDIKERDQVIEDLQKQIREKEQAVAQAKIAQEDPEYTIDDFMRVRDEDTGEVLELDRDQAELAWRRWKDGYDQRASERQAEQNRKDAEAQKQAQATRELMQKSADAYDSLAGLMDEYPELVSTSGKYDEDFAKEAMPIIEESIEYAPGTEPGNQNGEKPVIIGLKINPAKILKALKGISEKKRNLPLNGINDNVEPRSNVSVPHTRSSDPNVQAANELYKELGIKKRI